MKLTFDENKVTLSDMMEIEQGRTFAQSAKFLHKFVTDEAGQPVTPAQAWEFIRALSIPEMRRSMAEFWRYMSETRDRAVNPPTPGSS